MEIVSRDPKHPMGIIPRALAIIDEIIESHKAGKLKEVFGTGTAATVSMIRELKYKDYTMYFDTDAWTVCRKLKRRLNDIREGRTEDQYGWMWKV